jgi:hypothetical protein
VSKPRFFLRLFHHPRRTAWSTHNRFLSRGCFLNSALPLKRLHSPQHCSVIYSQLFGHLVRSNNSVVRFEILLDEPTRLLRRDLPQIQQLNRSRLRGVIGNGDSN